MKRTFISIVALASFATVGCTIKSAYMPPTPTNSSASKVFNAPFNKVWGGAIDWVAKSGLKINVSDKDSGLISATISKNLDKYADWGKLGDAGYGMSSGGYQKQSFSDKSGTISITIKTQGNNMSKVSVVVSFTCKVITKEAGAERMEEVGKIDVVGASMGILEQDFLDYLSTLK